MGDATSICHDGGWVMQPLQLANSLSLGSSVTEPCLTVRTKDQLGGVRREKGSMRTSTENSCHSPTQTDFRHYSSAYAWHSACNQTKHAYQSTVLMATPVKNSCSSSQACPFNPGAVCFGDTPQVALCFKLVSRSISPMRMKL